MATSKVLTDAEGNVSIKLPVAGTLLKFRPAKGKDLIQLERIVSNLPTDANGQPSNVEAMLTIACHFCLTEGITLETLLEGDAEDAAEVMKAVGNFRGLSNIR